MQICVEWMDSEQRLLVYRFGAFCKEDELYEAVELGASLIRTQLHRVNVIFDMRNNREFPRNMWAVVRWAFRVHPENFGCIVIVDPRGFVTNVVSTFGQIYPRIGQRVRCALNMECAMLQLQSIN